MHTPRHSRHKASGMVAALACVALSAVVVGCGEDLGDCDMPAAMEIVYASNGAVATKGQALMHDSCGQGVFCHASAATEGARHGAPAGMSFDMLPLPSGWRRTMEDREAIWNAVENGSMPPGRVGQEKLGDSGWSVDVEHSDVAPTLPSLATREGKAALRNWLACGAPVVEETKVPAWVTPNENTDDAGVDTEVEFASIYEEILVPNCVTSGCHDASGAGRLAMVEVCSAYAALLSEGNCGSARAVPGEDDSLLVDKLANEVPRCRERMPPLGPLANDDIERIRQWVASGAVSTCE